MNIGVKKTEPVISEQTADRISKNVGSISKLLFFTALLAGAIFWAMKNDRIAAAKKWIGGHIQSSSSAPTIGCGNGYSILPNANKVELVISSGDCWTDWQARPVGANRFLAEGKEKIDIQFAYSDGTKEDPIELNPLLRTYRPADGNRFLTGMRFKNNSGRNIPITIYLN